MEFGIDIFPDAWPDRITGQQFYNEVLDLVAEGESLGFSGVKIVEHYLHPYGGYCPSPIVFLAAAAQRTKTMRLITGAVLPAFSHPLKLVSELAQLDCLSNGRLDVGVARAFLPYEYDGFGVSMDESRGRFDEGIRAMLELWNAPRGTSFEGPFHKIPNAWVLPETVQKPHPPIWVAAIMTPESFINAGKNGFNLMIVPYLGEFEHVRECIALYEDAWKAAGHAGKRGKVMMVMHLYVAPTMAEARDEARAFIEQYVATFHDAANCWNDRASAQYKGYEALQQRLEEITYERVVKDTRAIIGDPVAAVEQANFLIEQFGDVNFSFQMTFGMMPIERSRRTMRLFAERCMPKLQRQPVTA
jgi:alkanesulfonate monooxygenase SsuD/methylene tetrahydromethanopterin reductase-like flavin-dependent oxidoreductase (luciferase family)